MRAVISFGYNGCPLYLHMRPTSRPDVYFSSSCAICPMLSSAAYSLLACLAARLNASAGNGHTVTGRNIPARIPSARSISTAARTANAAPPKQAMRTSASPVKYSSLRHVSSRFFSILSFSRVSSLSHSALLFVGKPLSS